MEMTGNEWKRIELKDLKFLSSKKLFVLVKIVSDFDFDALIWEMKKMWGKTMKKVWKKCEKKMREKCEKKMRETFEKYTV